MDRFIGLVGVAVLLCLAMLMSEDRRRFPWRLVGMGLLLQIVLAVLLLKTPGVAAAFDLLARMVNGVILQADAGIAFIFGEKLTNAEAPFGFIFAVKVLPVIIFFAALMSVLYHVGLMQRIVAALAWLLRGTLGVTGAEALAMASNIFVGQTEAPLCIRPLLPRMTRAQIATLMTGGFATIAGSVMAAYVGILGGVDEAARILFLKHLLAASVMSAPAAFVMARIIVPEREQPPQEELRSFEPSPAANIFDAAALGATDGLKLAANVAAMLIAFVALLALVNWPLGLMSDWAPVRSLLNVTGQEVLSLQGILGWMLTPLMWTLGIPWSDCEAAALLQAERLVLNEFVAYDHLGRMINASDGPLIGTRAAVLSTYALCGFANFSSIGIQIGGLSSLAPNQRRTIVTLGLKTMIGGAMACWMTAAVAGMVI